MPFLVFLDVKDTNGARVRENIVYHVLKDDVLFTDIHKFICRIAKQVPDISGENVSYAIQPSQTLIDVTKKVKEVLKDTGARIIVTVPGKEQPKEITPSAKTVEAKAKTADFFKNQNSSEEVKKKFMDQMKAATANQERLKAKMFARSMMGQKKTGPSISQPSKNPLITFSNVPPKPPTSK